MTFKVRLQNFLSICDGRKKHLAKSDNKIKKYNILYHSCFGCEKIQERYVYEEKELFSDKMKRYVFNHKYHDFDTEVFSFESKKWSLDDVLGLDKSNGWSPRYWLKTNGFRQVGEIDLIDIFDNNPMKEISENGKIFYLRSFTWDRPPHNLREKKEEIQKELEKYDYKNRHLVIFRTSRSSACAYWDFIFIFSKSRYPFSFYRLKINLGLRTRKFRKLLDSAHALKQLGSRD